MNLIETGELLRALPGAIGSGLSLLWLRDTLVRKTILFLGGVAFSIGATPEIAKHTHLEPGFLLGFMLGLGSMMVIRKLFETLQAFPLGNVLRDAVRHWLKLPAATASSTKPGEL